MKQNLKDFISTYRTQVIIWVVMILGLYLVVIRSFGPGLSWMPGDIEDTRFNNFVLEHFSRWVMGQEKSFWSPSIFYAYPFTLAFSDAFLGSAPFYFIFRCFGLGREAAFQAWYAFGFMLNYISVVFVLSRFKLQPLAISAGAFFFTFGLPMLAQNAHVQLVYRIGIPLACYFLWKFSQRPQLGALTLFGFWFVLQLYFSIYIGFFLFLLFIPFFFLFPLTGPDRKIIQYFAFWPQKLKEAWLNATARQRFVNIIGFVGLLAALLILIYPYLWVSSHYGFSRAGWEKDPMIPRIQSYFLADRAQLWQPISRLFSNPPMAHEHQLFVGIAVSLLILIGILWKQPLENRSFAFYNLWAVGFLVVFTLYYNNLSIYKLVYNLPGFTSIRAVTRVILVIMWPLAIFIATVIDRLISSSSKKFPYGTIIACSCVLLMVMESTLFNQAMFPIAAALNRLNVLRAQLPRDINQESILFVATDGHGPWWLTEIDSMLLGQELGISVLNGYSSNFPPGYGPAVSCNQMNKRISQYLKFSNQSAKENYLKISRRVIPIGFSDCDTASLGPALDSTNP